MDGAETIAKAHDIKRGIVLSGGGARGAYEAGVLSYVFGELPESLVRPGIFPVISGTSVGAIHACYLAGAAQLPRSQVERITDLWTRLRIEEVMRFGARDLARLPWDLAALFRHDGSTRGMLVDADYLHRFVLGAVPWGGIDANLRSGLVETLTVSATHVATGRTIVFVDQAGRPVPPWTRDARRGVKAVRMAPAHALASAAIPVLFPCIPIERSYYCDGGLRQATPLAPALRFGVNRALVVALSHNPAEFEQGAERAAAAADDDAASRAYEDERYPGPFILMGKVLDALLLDHVDYDLARLAGVNLLLRNGTEVFGPDFEAQLNRTAETARGVRYRHVDTLVIRPSHDLGGLAENFVHEERKRIRGPLRWFLNAIGADELLGTSDLLSYLLFDGEYAARLIALGRADAHAKRDELIAFFEDRPMG